MTLSLNETQIHNKLVWRVQYKFQKKQSASISHPKIRSSAICAAVPTYQNKIHDVIIQNFTHKFPPL
jgi:hypothetical protein